MELQDIISSGLLELYATGLASPAESKQVENWVKQYPEVAAELNAIQMGLENYAQANAIAPLSTIKDKIFAEINTATAGETKYAEPAKIIPVNNYWKWAVAASVALLIGSVVMTVNYYNKYETAANSLKEKEELLAQAEQKIKEPAAPLDIVPVSLKGQDATLDATAKIFWMKNNGDVMIDASNLPDPPQGKQYQFWGIVDGVPVDGGLIITNDKGQKLRMQRMKSFGKAEAFAVSLEKEGGSPTPTKVVSMGKI